MAHIVILGGGFGGVTVANTLRAALDPVHLITVVDRKADFMMGLRKLWILTGQGTREEGSRPLAALADRGIEVLRAEVKAIRPDRRIVETSSGELAADFLVVALGAEPAPERVPGFQDYNLYNQYDVTRAAKRLAALKAGRVLVGILGLPYKCPPAPYEAALMVDDFLRQRGLREAVTLEVFTPQPIALPVAGAAPSALVESLLAEHGIGFHAGAVVERVKERQVALADGRELAFDLLLGVPPHRLPEVLADNPLAGGKPWLTVNPFTLHTDFDGVWAIGDVTGIPVGQGLALPKAGVFAEAQGRVVAAQILATLRGSGATPAFDGLGYCFMEVGAGQAVQVEGNFYADGGPEVQAAPPAAAALERKRAFERDRLAAWFGR